MLNEVKFNKNDLELWSDIALIETLSTCDDEDKKVILIVDHLPLVQVTVRKAVRAIGAKIEKVLVSEAHKTIHFFTNIPIEEWNDFLEENLPYPCIVQPADECTCDKCNTNGEPDPA
jgi:hypothetical protein